MDFFSIGTNDLTQYTLVIDRQNARLDSIYDPHHEAVLRMIRLVVENAHKEGIWVGRCGELGADFSMTETLVKMGVDVLSVSPACVLQASTFCPAVPQVAFLVLVVFHLQPVSSALMIPRVAVVCLLTSSLFTPMRYVFPLSN